MPEINIILGPPGTGKTENLLRIVDRELKNGTDPSAIAFVSFTTRATDEARNRAKIKFYLKALPFCRQWVECLTAIHWVLIKRGLS